MTHAALGGVVVATWAGLASPAQAASKFWKGSLSEFWTNGGNWELLSEPASADTAIFSNSAGDGIIRTSVTLSQNRTVARWDVSGDVPIIGPYSFSRINSAVLTVTGDTNIGLVSTTTSTVALNGFLLNTNALNVSGQMTANITGSANITTTGKLSVFSPSVLNLSGGSLNLAGNIQHDVGGTINVNGGSLNFGANAVMALFNPASKLNFSGGYNILNNARIIAQGGSDVVGTSFIDVGNGGTGRLRVDGSGSTFTAQSSTSDWGRGATGNATVNIQLGAVATVPSLRVGTVDATANVLVSAGTLTANNAFEAGGGTASRTVQMTLQESGTMTLNGTSTFNNQADLDFISGTLNFNQNATINEGARLDRTGGTLNIASGKKLIINGGVYADTTTGGQILSNGAGIEVRGGFGRFDVAQFFDIGTGSILVESSARYNSPAGAITTDWASAAGTVTTATVRSGGQINIGSLRIAGGGADVNIENNGKIQATTLTVGGAGTSNAPITLNGGNLTVLTNASLGSGTDILLTDPAGSGTGQNTFFIVGGTLSMTGNAVVRTSGEEPFIGVVELSMSGTSKLFLEPGADMSINYGAVATPLNTIRGFLQTGFNGGNWLGNGITSSAAQFQTNLAIGYVNSPDPQFGSMEVKLTLKGDSNLDGMVNFPDLLALAQNYDQSNRFWQQGDFDYNGSVGFSDLLGLAQNFGSAVVIGELSILTAAAGSDFAAEWALARSMVPEPGALAVLILALPAAFRRRR